jgi:hypothetical protein
VAVEAAAEEPAVLPVMMPPKKPRKRRRKKKRKHLQVLVVCLGPRVEETINLLFVVSLMVLLDHQTTVVNRTNFFPVIFSFKCVFVVLMLLCVSQCFVRTLCM